MADAGAGGGKSGNKNRRRREKEKKKKLQQGATTSGAQDEDVEEESPVARFERELTWCVDQLEAGLQNMKPDDKQMRDTMKILHTLKSPKASMPKKRQMMWAVFGDYRKKILEEERKSKQGGNSSI
ncbi:C8orf33 [Branchiostoma lanceolatum]|uniref:C8orf33 protein n=1 Tax=Branchiostoma lanceolatum TaxID=7740 RepID=A0A8J9YSM3_BRALA|nr:C8orf33 [Branchiostoma lanceolatum]